jgi:adenosylmethionine-8-amino-7-oxononanoate aminotransferase
MVDVSPSRYHFVPGASGPTIVGGEGCWLFTDDGRRILDAAGGAMVANIGHGRAVVADAVRDALHGGAYVVPIWSTPHRERLRDLLVESWLPAGMGNVFFTSGGSESADSALRLARATHLASGRPERGKVIGRHPSYHGITLGALAATSRSCSTGRKFRGTTPAHWSRRSSGRIRRRSRRSSSSRSPVRQVPA